MVPHVQLLSLSMMFSGLVHVVTVSRLRLIAREYPTVQIPHTFLTHLMDIWVVSTFWLTSGLFPLFGSYGQCRCDHLCTRFGCTCVFIPLGYALLDHMVTLRVTTRGTGRLFSTAVVPVYIPSAVQKGSSCSMVLSYKGAWPIFQPHSAQIGTLDQWTIRGGYVTLG